MRVKHHVFLLSCLLSTTSALTTSVVNASDTLTAEADTIEAPDLEFLEFLGSFETADGQWINPMEVETILKIETTKELSNEPNDKHNKTKEESND